MVELHNTLARSGILFAVAVGLWAAWSFIRREGVSSSYLGALAIGEGLMLVQGVLGIVLVLTGAQPHNLLHFLYGFLSALSWPGVYIYTHARTARAEVGWYALASLLTFGFTVRAVMTA